MEHLFPQLAQLFNDTLSSGDDAVISSATEALERLSVLPEFPFSLVSIATGGDNQGQRIAAATYLKNFIKRRDNPSSKASNEFKTCLLVALLQVEPAVLKVLVEAFRIIVVSEFVKENSWPELIPELRSAIQSSNFITEDKFGWDTINGLVVLQAVLRPFQYFLDPKLAKEPVPPQLELIAKEILVPLLTIFHRSVDKVLSLEVGADEETERILLIICKCMYFAVRSHMPSALVPLLPTFCGNLCQLLHSLALDGSGTTNSEEGCLLRLKIGKRSLLIFFALVTRHRKHSDKLMPDMINSVHRIVKQICYINKLDFLSERIISLAFDVISHVLETGPGWRLLSPLFSSLLNSAIFPALVMNEKDVAEWEEDADEYIRKNLPSDLEEISGWKEDLFTARKSAINLLGVISIKGPPVVASSSKRKKGDKKKGKEQYSSVGELLVLPFLSKFPIPSAVGSDQTKISNDYYGVLMAYGGLQDFLRERNPGYTTSLVQTRVLPLYSLSPSLPYLVATANWVLGVLASCLSPEMSTSIYCSLLKALTMPDFGDTSCYPVRVSAAGAVAELLENDYPPPEWLPLLQVVVSRVDNEDENESSILFQLLSTVVESGNENVAVHIPSVVPSVVGDVLRFIPPNPVPWPQVVERGFAVLAVMSNTWEDYVAKQIEQDETSSKWHSGWVIMARTFSALLQEAWLTSMQPKEEVSHALPPSCLNDASTILRSIMQSVTDPSMVSELKISDLLVAWTDLIAEWQAWEELEDLSIFDSIREVVNLHRKFELKNFFVRGHPAPPAPPVPQRSIVEGIGAFVSEAILQYPSAVWRACSCVHLLLHNLSFSYETEGVKQSLVITLSRAAFSRFREIHSKPAALWKPLLLAISSCYLCYPDIVEMILEKEEVKGFTVWASALSYISTSSFEPGLSVESDIKLIVMTLTKVVERLLERARDPWSGLLQDCFVSLVEATIRLKEVQEEEDEDDGEDEDEDEVDVETDDDDDDDDEDSEDEREETEQEFLDRYAEAALALENGIIVEEGDVEEQDQELELGVLCDIDPQRAVLSLMERYKQVLPGQKLPPQLVTGFLNIFPEYASFIQHSR